jgi:hypothetical protein
MTAIMTLFVRWLARQKLFGSGTGKALVLEKGLQIRYFGVKLD